MIETKSLAGGSSRNFQTPRNFRTHRNFRTPRGSRHSSRAFTLVEVLMACGVASVLFGVLFMVFSGGQRSVTKGTQLSSALTSAVYLTQRIEADLIQLAVQKELAENPVKVNYDGSGMTFTVATEERRNHDKNGLEQVTYVLSRSGKVLRIKRNDKLLPEVFLKKFKFTFFPAGEENSKFMHYVRVTGETTDHLGKSSFVFSRLYDLPQAFGLIEDESWHGEMGPIIKNTRKPRR